MSTALKNLQQQYAAEIVKADADERLLKRLEDEVRFLRKDLESTG